MGDHLWYAARVSHRVLHLRPCLLQPRHHVSLSVSRYEVIICENRVISRYSWEYTLRNASLDIVSWKFEFSRKKTSLLLSDGKFDAAMKQPMYLFHVNFIFRKYIEIIDDRGS